MSFIRLRIKIVLFLLPFRFEGNLGIDWYGVENFIFGVIMLSVEINFRR